MKTIISIACLVLLVGALVEGRPKRSVIITSPVVAASPLVATSVVHSHPSTVVS